MGSSSTSSGSDAVETNLHHQVQDQRKRKRMISNRESARRSRMRKQKHLDDLLDQASQLGKENNQILMNINITTQLYQNIDAENSVLKAQMDELTQRLQSLNEIVEFVNSSIGSMDNEGYSGDDDNNNNRSISAYDQQICNDDSGFMMMMNSGFNWENPLFFHQVPVMATPSADMIMY